MSKRLQQLRRAKRHRYVDDDDDEGPSSGEEMVSSTTSEKPDMNAVEMRSGGATMSTQGFRGTLAGNGLNNTAMAEKYNEQQAVHSRWVNFMVVPWIWLSDAGISEGLPSGALQTKSISTQTAPGFPAGGLFTRTGGVSPSMCVHSYPINFTLRDFADTKLINRWANQTNAVYDKFRLVNFTVTLQIDTYANHDMYAKDNNVYKEDGTLTATTLSNGGVAPQTVWAVGGCLRQVRHRAFGKSGQH